LHFLAARLHYLQIPDFLMYLGDYDPKCGKDWEFDPGGELYCYHFNDYRLRTWEKSREYCIEMGGDLLSINSQYDE